MFWKAILKGFLKSWDEHHPASIFRHPSIIQFLDISHSPAPNMGWTNCRLMTDGRCYKVCENRSPKRRNLCRSTFPCQFRLYDCLAFNILVGMTSINVMLCEFVRCLTTKTGICGGGGQQAIWLSYFVYSKHEFTDVSNMNHHEASLSRP